MPDSSQRPPQDCVKCENPVEGPYCHGCALWRKKLKDVWFIICNENGIYQDLLNTYESSDDNSNVVNAPQEPFVVKQDPDENSSQNPPQIDHNCCYECGDSLDGIFCQRCTCKSCGKGAHIGYNWPPKVLIISNPEPCNNQTIDELPQTLPSFDPACYSKKGNSLPYVSKPNFVDDSPNLVEQLTSLCDMIGQYIQKKEEEKRIKEEQVAKARYWKIPVCYDDDDDEESSIPLKDIIISGLPPCVAITPALSTEEPVDSLIMEDEHLDTIPTTESDEFIRFSVENLVENPSESEDFSDIESECDVPVCDNFTTFSNPLFDADDDVSSSDDESFSDEDVPNEIYSNPLFDEEIISVKIDASIISKIDSLVEQFSGELAHIDLIPPGTNEADFDLEEDIRFIERFDSLMEEIDIFLDGDGSIPPGIESDDYDSEDDDNSTSRPEFESFHVDYPDSGDSTIDVVEDIPVDVPNILPTHPALQLDFDFIPSHNDLGSDLDNSSPSGDRNKIYDPGICIEVESTRFLAPLSPVIDTLLPFSSENEDKVFNHGVLAYKEKSPPSSSHRGLKALQLSPESPMLIHGDNTPNLGVRHLHFYPP
ncbi:hypothetical protein Tco_1315819 [Tanacetum coccineum]